uniref:SIR2-like domain-containing protein n=1 Tax=Lotharella oceanica TaxID=641309 RepID=A0A7S2TXK7_9EUKA|mmetsp:Transcript_34290/g.63610  ORF Transcript_34290/g.63610 Transcript_34290/m.63610 type:complete len:691 (+) Transcript_34290:107-2179(+)
MAVHTRAKRHSGLGQARFPGHVFVALTDIRQIACDAVLYTSRDGYYRPNQNSLRITKPEGLKVKAWGGVDFKSINSSLGAFFRDVTATPSFVQAIRSAPLEEWTYSIGETRIVIATQSTRKPHTNGGGCPETPKKISGKYPVVVSTGGKENSAGIRNSGISDDHVSPKQSKVAASSHVPLSPIEQARAYLLGFLLSIQGRLATRKPHCGRAAHLICVEAVPPTHLQRCINLTEWMRWMYSSLKRWTNVTGIDACICTTDMPMFSALQMLRRTIYNQDGKTQSLSAEDDDDGGGSGGDDDDDDGHRHTHDDHLTEALKQEAIKLGRLARTCGLQVWLGAGVSMGAGLPRWDKLIEDLAREAGLGIDDDQSFKRMDVLDKATLIVKKLNDVSYTKSLVAKMCSAARFTLSHSLLATLPGGVAITTNYDTLYEQAYLATGMPEHTLRVVPNTTNKNADGKNVHHRLHPNHDHGSHHGHHHRYHDHVNGGKRLIKMHGCAREYDTIVLTRQDYLRYDREHTALAGIVQGKLMDGQTLIVGFSLTDVNFARIYDNVAMFQMLHGNGIQKLGTAIFGSDDASKRMLWGDAFNMVTMQRKGEKLSEVWYYRRQEIYLDLVVSVAFANRTPHLLNKKYDALLSAEEKTLKERLERLRLECSGLVHLPAWRFEIEPLLRRLGMMGNEEHARRRSRSNSL